MNQRKRFFVPSRVKAVALASMVLLQCSPRSLAQTPPRDQLTLTFLNAVANNDTKTALQILEGNTNLARSSAYLSKLPLLEAAAAGNVTLVRRLIDLGADINATGDTMSSAGSHNTALHVSISYNKPAVCQFLLEAGADPNLMAFGFMTPLHMAITQRETVMAGWLLDYGADPFLEKRFTNDKTTPFELAIRNGAGRLVSRMLGQDPSHPLGAMSRVKPTPANRLSSLATTADKLLAERGPTLLATAAQRGESEAVQALIKARVSAKGTTEQGLTAIQAAARSEAAEDKASNHSPERWRQIHEMLVKEGADDDTFAATARGDLDRARHLLSADTNLVRIRDREGQSVLHWAVQNDQLPLTSFWLEVGVLSAATNSAGQTALHQAAAKGLAGQVTILLAAHAPTGVRDTNGWTPLDVAIQAKQPEIIRLLLSDKTVEPRPERGIGNSLHEAAAGGKIGALASLTESTGQMETRNELGHTPLQVSVQRGHLAAAALLVDKGADINARDPDGNTLLHQILLLEGPLIVHDCPSTNWLDRLREGSLKPALVKLLTVQPYEQGPNPILQTASFLLACGIDATATNKSGLTALQLVAEEKTSRRVFFVDDDRAILLRLLGSAGGNINQADANGDTVLHRTGQDTDADRIASLIAGGADVNATNHQGQTPLHRFAEKISGWDLDEEGTNQPFQLLVKSKSNVNAQDNDGLTPLHVLAAAETSFKKEAMKALLDAGARPNLRDRQGRTPVHLVLSAKWPWSEAGVCLQLLVQAGADLSAKDNQGKTPLHYLAALGDQKPLFFIRGISDPFVAEKVDFQARDNEGNTPLHIATKTGTGDVFDWLVKQGASLDASNSLGQTPRLLAARSQGTKPFSQFPAKADTDVFQAVREGKIESLAALARADPALLTMTNRGGQSPLRLAAMLRRTNVVEFLERQGVAWDAVSAVICGRIEPLRAILSRQPAAITTTINGSSLLHLAAANGDRAMTDILLGAGADLNAVDPQGFSPLGAALLNRQPEVETLLRRKGAEENLFDAVRAGHLDDTAVLTAKDRTLVNATNGAGTPIVLIAVSTGHADVLKLLLDRGSPLDCTEARTGRTPLHLAAIHDRAEAAKLLLERGARVEIADLAGFTPLHLAAVQGSAETAALLLKHEAKPDATMDTLNSRPSTPVRSMPVELDRSSALHLAALAGQTNMIQLLLASGASVNQPDGRGRTPLDLATIPYGTPLEMRLFQWRLVETPAGFNSAWPSQKVDIGSLFQQRKAAADLLEKSGGKHLQPGASSGATPRSPLKSN